MAYNIRKTKEFLRTFLSVVSYIEEEWGLKAAIKFQMILDSKLEMLSNDLIAGKKTVKNKEIRKLAITKHNKIYYKKIKNEIIILTLFENKMNPKRNRYE